MPPAGTHTAEPDIAEFLLAAFGYAKFCRDRVADAPYPSLQFDSIDNHRSNLPLLSRRGLDHLGDLFGTHSPFEHFAFQIRIALPAVNRG